MPFQTDPTWTPSAYRKAYTVYLANAPKTDGPLMPRKASTTSPRHEHLSARLKSLLTWRAATNPDRPLATSWMRYDLRPDNDNCVEEGDEREPQLYDTTVEFRPTPDEMRRQWEGGDISYGEQPDVPLFAASDISGERAPRRACRVVTRMGGLRFSNGENEERCTVLRFGKPAMGRVRMPAGALIRYNGRKPAEEYGAAKGSLPETDATVGIGGHNPGSGLCPDPVVDAEWAVTLRNSVDAETAMILDTAITAANFREVGEVLGKEGKNAERYGKAAVLDACAKLDAALIAANGNEPVKVAANDNIKKKIAA